MPQTINYFSAEVAEPNLRQPFKRIRVRNRNHPSVFVDHQWKREGAQTVIGQLRELYHSPVLKVEPLWQDEYLGLFFYRTIEEF